MPLQAGLASASASGVAADGIRCAVSGDGSKVLFTAQSDALVSGDNNGAVDLFLKDLNGNGVQRLVAAAVLGQVFCLGMTPNAQTVVYTHSSPSILPPIFIKNLLTGSVSRVTPAPGSLPNVAGYQFAGISDDGLRLALIAQPTSTSSGDDTTALGPAHLLLRDLGTSQWINLDAQVRFTTEQGRARGNARIAPDGRGLAFTSCASHPEAATTTPNVVCSATTWTLAHLVGDMRWRMQRTGQWHGHQTAGRRWPVACVSREITQRCNLDCTLCYLSDSSEAVRDLPLAEVFRRIDLILLHYGPGTDVQVSGGEPTLRRHDELVAIVRRIASLGLRASLFTNGTKASRAVLVDLSAAGLTDVAFHVDTTQQRAGYSSEQDLNALRRAYIERAGGLPISVFFNATVHAGNFDAVPMLSAFFVAQADVVRFASFQLQAETGRGVLGARVDVIGNDSVAQRLQQGSGVADLGFNVLAAGHHDCNRSAVLLVVNGRAHDAFANRQLVRRFMRETADLVIDRGTPWRAVRSLLAAAVARPRLGLAALRWALGAGPGLAAAPRSGRHTRRVHKLTLFPHNVMDACALDAQRIDACVFMAITQDGPMSMCAYNAQRDHYLLRPLQTAQGTWQPLRAGAGGAGGVASAPIKWLKGRPRADALQARKAGGASHAAGRPGGPDRPVWSDMPDKPDKPNRVDRPNRADRPDRAAP